MLVEAMRHAPAGAAATLACFVDLRGERYGRPCFIVFLQIVHGLALYGRRRMRVGAACWPVLTHDEVAFLRCIDAGMRNDEAALTAHVAWLVRSYGAHEFAAYVRTLASLIREPMFRTPLVAGVPLGDDVVDAGVVRRPNKIRPAQDNPAPAFPIAIK
jgi:hypothetical protein